MSGYVFVCVAVLGVWWGLRMCCVCGVSRVRTGRGAGQDTGREMEARGVHTVFMAHLHCAQPPSNPLGCGLACLPPLACLTLLSQALGPSLPRGARAGGGHPRERPSGEPLIRDRLPDPEAC